VSESPTQQRLFSGAILFIWNQKLHLVNVHMTAHCEKTALRCHSFAKLGRIFLSVEIIEEIAILSEYERYGSP